MTVQSRRFVIDHVPSEALTSELATFLNIPLETSDTKLEMAMDMTGTCKGVAFVTLPYSKSNNLMWSNWQQVSHWKQEEGETVEDLDLMWMPQTT